MDIDSTRASDAAVIRLCGIHKRFERSEVFRGLDLAVDAGEVVVVLGGSGSGKSVLLKILLGLLVPDRGSLSIFGSPANGLTEEEWQPIRRRSGMLFQAGAIFDSLSVGENVAFPLRERRVGEEEIRRAVEERLEWVGLPGTSARPPSELSGGQRKRVALARTIATTPELLLYDEPTTGLDPLTGKRISELVRSVNQRLGATAIVVTHDLVCASIVARRWVFLHEGRVAADGAPEEILRSGPRELKEFLDAGRLPNGKQNGGELIEIGEK